MKHYKHYWLSLMAITFIAIGCDESSTTQDDSSKLPDSTTCTNGTWNCDDNVLFKCISNHWETIKTCGDGMTCNAETAECEPKTIPEENGNCTNGDWKCYNNELFKCISNHWEMIKTCGDGTTCNEQIASCIKITNPDVHCLTNEHLFAGRCEPDDVNHCGSHLNDCTKISGWKSGDCIDKVCFAEECALDYHLASLVDDGEEKTICEGDTKDACGSINTKCRDDSDDSANCGQCGNRCSVGEICKSGECEMGTGYTNCDGTGIDISNDSTNCGRCGNKCDVGEICRLGKCENGTGGTYCDGARVDTSNDTANCGQCGNKCGVDEVCNRGKCQAGNGYTHCDGRVIDTSTDLWNCGQCGNNCDDGEICNKGKCS